MFVFFLMSFLSPFKSFKKDNIYAFKRLFIECDLTGIFNILCQDFVLREKVCHEVNFSDETGLLQEKFFAKQHVAHAFNE